MTSAHAVYAGRDFAGTISEEARGFAAFDAAGKRLGSFPTRTDAVRAVWNARRDAGSDVLNAITPSNRSRTASPSQCVPRRSLLGQLSITIPTLQPASSAIAKPGANMAM